jgi:hypothetical protein
VQEIDDNDDYMLATSRKTELSALLLQHHLLSSTCLTNKISIQQALEPYEDKYPETKDFLKWVVVPYFTFENSANYPVTTLTAAESLSAVTKIFSTINTTGKKLTPIEIVTAVLFSHDINLKQQVREFHQASDYLSNMDTDGETLLQTIALLANKSPKKSMLPKTITHERFKAYYGDALDLLDRAGQCLTSELGVGFKDTDKLIPYSSILAPMAVCFEEIKKLKGNDKSKALDKIHKWFIGAAIGQRYIQGAGSKQESDAREMKKWIKEAKSTSGPKWLDTVHLTKEMVTAPSSGAIAKLVRCLINREKPIDPLELTKIGYYEYADECPEEHHIWPKRFCSDHIANWDINVDTAEHAMNIMPVSHKTNKKWANMDPKNQMDDIRMKIPTEAKRKEVLEKLLISDECIEILERPNKTKKDYLDFLEARFKMLQTKLAAWDFTLGEEDYQDETADEVI